MTLNNDKIFLTKSKLVKLKYESLSIIATNQHIFYISKSYSKTGAGLSFN